MNGDHTPRASTLSAPSWERRIAAFVVGLVGLVFVGVGFAVLALARETIWLLVGGVIALAGLLAVVASTRIVRLPARRALIAVLAAFLVGPPIGHAVRSHADFAKRYSPPRDTATDLRNLGVALEARAIDEGGYPSTNAVGALAPLLEGRYIRQVPVLDAWGEPLRYESDGTGPDARYFVASAGPDRRWQHAHLAEYRDLPGPHGDDIVYTNGGFVTSPGRGEPAAR